MDQKTRKMVLTVVVGIFALVCLFDMFPTFFSYFTPHEWLEEREIRLLRVEMTEDNAIVMTLRFTTVSDTDVVTQKIVLNIYANREYLGNYSINERATLKEGDTDIIFKVVISPYYMPKLEEIVESSQYIEWHITGGAVLEYRPLADTTALKFDTTWVMMWEEKMG